MIRQFIKEIPLLYKTALKIKHGRWNKITVNEFNKYIGSHQSAKLQMGAGLNDLPNWFNTDYFARPTIFFLDVTKPFPFPNNTFEFAYSEHHIEHISYLDAQKMLSETFRVMKPGGYIKIITPDLYQYLKSYTDKLLGSDQIKNHVNEWIYAGFANASTYIPVNGYYEAHFVNDIFMNYEHKFIYDQQSLSVLLEKAGFIVKPETNHPEFKSLETHSSDFDKNFNLTLLAQKPL